MPKLVIFSVLIGKQGSMGPFFDYRTLMEYGDFVAEFTGRQADG